MTPSTAGTWVACLLATAATYGIATRFAGGTAALPTPPAVAPLPAEVAREERSEDLPAYVRRGHLSGRLRSVGSDTMNNLMSLWAQGFREFHHNVHVQVEGRGSGSGPPALIAGDAEFAPMTREMDAKEIAQYERSLSLRPTGVVTAMDMLGVFVHRDNPLLGLSLLELDAIFSRDRRRGFDRDLRVWGDLGLGGEWAGKPIVLYGRNPESGTRACFKHEVLRGGEFKESVRPQAGSASVIQGVARDRYGIGYAGIGYATPSVRAVPLAREPGRHYVAPVPDYAHTRSYPLARRLHVYVARPPGLRLDPLREEFLRFALSRDGQAVVSKDGFIPLPPSVCRDQLSALGVR